ncbi:hypothetical protein LQE85_03750 [Stenotrophomonas rhizophila]|uniref:hypothetical protein n=1 Tax=Stenotrophomonas rhizophila TaxID=216778 RepID=UPI00201D04A3|nr:hypothetical protein [Stenotrophomonas rhizophila]UQY88358.1 hypothetical protein LQE85_03750 [Stenotrophomonas rhizophila]
MNIKFLVPALLVLCGAACMSPVHAADYRCMVFSGADGKTPEASSNADGKYAIKAGDLKAAEAGALAAATRYKKNSVTLTKAQCDAVAGASSTTTSAPTTTTDPTRTAPSAPATGATKDYRCAVHDADGNVLKGETEGYFQVAASNGDVADGLAKAKAEAKYGAGKVDHVDCAPMG